MCLIIGASLSLCEWFFLFIFEVKKRATNKKVPDWKLPTLYATMSSIFHSYRKIEFGGECPVLMWAFESAYIIVSLWRYHGGYKCLINTNFAPECDNSFRFVGHWSVQLPLMLLWLLFLFIVSAPNSFRICIAMSSSFVAILSDWILDDRRVHTHVCLFRVFDMFRFFLSFFAFHVHKWNVSRNSNGKKWQKKRWNAME